MSLLGHTYAGILGILLKEIRKKTFCTLAKPFLHNELKERHMTDPRQSHAKYPVYYTFQNYIFLLLSGLPKNGKPLSELVSAVSINGNGDTL